jgi:hypothetical protein
MPDCDNDNRTMLLVEDDTVIANAKPRPGSTLQPLHVSSSRGREFRQASVDSSPNILRQFDPLAAARGSKDYRLHEEISHIAILASRRQVR